MKLYIKNLKRYRLLKKKYRTKNLKINFYPSFRKLEIPLFSFKLLYNKLFYRNIVLIARKVVYTTLIYIKKNFPKVTLLYECEGDVVSEHKYIASYDSSYPLGSLNEKYQINYNIFKISDLVIAGTESMTTLLRMRYPILDNKITYAIPTFSKKLFYYDQDIRNKIRKDLNIEDKKVFIYCGDIVYPWQNMDTNLKIFKKVKEINDKAFLVLLVHKTQIDYAREKLEFFNINPEDYYVSSVTNTEVAKYLMAADIGFVLRDIYTFNYVAPTAKTGEYLATGLPVIYTKALKLYNPFIEEIDYCLVEYRKEAFFNRIEEIAEYTVTNEKRQYISDLTIEKYAFESNSGQYIRIIEEALNKFSK